MNRVKITKEYLKKSYSELKSISKIAKSAGYSYTYIHKQLKKYNIVVLNYGGRKIFNCNENLFKEETEQSFYWAGFLAADGNISDENRLSIHLSIKDKEHLEKFIKDISYSGKIEIKNDMIMLRISSKEICKDLIKFNVIPRKTLIYTLPEWLKSHHLLNHFIRGYFDGDGCATIKKQDNQLELSLAGTVKFITEIRNILEKECNFIHNMNEVKEKSQSKCAVLAYRGNKKAKIMADYLYKNATIYLNRKYNIIYQSNKMT